MTTSNMTFYIEEVDDGDPPPEPPPDDGSGGEGFDPSDILDLGDLTGHMMNGQAVNLCPEPPSPPVTTPAEENSGTSGTGLGSEGQGGEAPETAGSANAGRSAAPAAVTATAAAAEGEFQMGALVVLRGLQAKPELNGCTGQVCGAAGSAGGAAGTGRYPVELDAGQGTFTFKPANLELRPSWRATLIESASNVAAAVESATPDSAGSSPEGRGGAAFVVLPLRQTSVDSEGVGGKGGKEEGSRQQLAAMIGGADRRGQHYSDTWVLNLDHGNEKPVGQWTRGTFSQSASSNSHGPSARSGHSAVAFPPPSSPARGGGGGTEADHDDDGLAGVVTVFGGSNLATQEGFGDTYQLLVGKDGSLGWRAIAVGSSPLPNASSSPKPRNAHAAVSFPGNCGRDTAAVTAASVAIASEKEEARVEAAAGRPMMVVIGGSTMDEGPTMDVLVLENANEASATWHHGGEPLNCSGRKPKGREMHSATVLPSNEVKDTGGGGGVVCVCGGRLEDDTIALDCWLLTVQYTQGSPTKSNSKGNSSSSSSDRGNGTASDTSGCWVGTWLQLTSAALPSPRCGHVAAWLPSTRFSSHSDTGVKEQVSSSSRGEETSNGCLVLFGGTDGAGLPKGLMVFEEGPANSAAAVGNNQEGKKNMHWRAETLPLEGRLSAAAAAITPMRRGGTNGCALLVFGGVTAAADSADAYLIEPPSS